MARIISKWFKKITVNNQPAFLMVVIVVAFVLAHHNLREKTKFSDTNSAVVWTPQKEYLINENGSNVFLPSILNDEDRKIYKSIFRLQDSENWLSADIQISKLQDRTLMGHVAAHRILHKYYTPSKNEIKSWIEKFSDHPQAYKIYKLAGKSDPTLKSISNDMKKDYLFGYGDGSGLSRSIEHSLSRGYWGQRNAAYNLWKQIHYHIRRGRITYSYDLLKSEKYQSTLKKSEIDMAKTSISLGYFAYNKDKEALKVAKSAIKGSKSIPNAYWLAGISSWRLGLWAESASYFSKLATIKKSTKWQRSSGAYWASRAFRKTGDNSRSKEMMEIAQQYPRTFYGMLASVYLDRYIDLEWDSTKLSQSDVNNISKIPNIRRALALIEISRPISAEKELRKLFPKSTLFVKKRILAFAKILNIPGLEVRMASMISGRKNGHFDDSLYPIPAWKPKDGYTINPALLLAFARHESGFNPFAKSHAGAKGLMQLMPKTAHYVAKKNGYEITSSSLFTPEKNLTLGQDYLEYLLTRRKINGNLFFMAAAYNAGPSALERWKNKIKYNNDPLLFIESIPSGETRNFIKRIMSNYWIYNERLGYNHNSLNDVLNGEWPTYNFDNDIEERKKHKVAFWRN